MSINWSDPSCKITDHFTVHDACYLPSWGVLHSPSTSEIDNLLKIFQKMEQIRSFLGDKAINVHCAIRPILNAPGNSHNGECYNDFVEGASQSAHKIGLAVDFDVVGLSCDEVRAKLMCKLAEFNIRMENKPLSNWVHCDNAPPKPNRYFVP